jgi:hypothetical protein
MEGERPRESSIGYTIDSTDQTRWTPIPIFAKNSVRAPKRGCAHPTGTFSSVTVPDNRWHAIYSSDGTLKLIFVNGTLISLR